MKKNTSNLNKILSVIFSTPFIVIYLVTFIFLRANLIAIAYWPSFKAGQLQSGYFLPHISNYSYFLHTNFSNEMLFSFSSYNEYYLWLLFFLIIVGIPAHIYKSIKTRKFNPASLIVLGLFLIAFHLTIIL